MHNQVEVFYLILSFPNILANSVALLFVLALLSLGLFGPDDFIFLIDLDSLLSQFYLEWKFLQYDYLTRLFVCWFIRYRRKIDLDQPTWMIYICDVFTLIETLSSYSNSLTY